MFELIGLLLVIGAMALTGFTLLGCVTVLMITLALMLIFGAIGVLIQWAPWLLLAGLIYWLVSEKRCKSL
ncbi:envelope stress response protein PspG [Motilimonas sp. KMU-193]|uniref:envelope stress response protein PspG n=1 Tax=Motilimonas sp. KMU-193 TaxID=3388668 RepID=UPI00396B285A